MGTVKGHKPAQSTILRPPVNAQAEAKHLEAGHARVKAPLPHDTQNTRQLSAKEVLNIISS
jgi:hypothetical protein